MASSPDHPDSLPQAVKDNVDRIGEVSDQSEARLSRLQSGIESISSFFGSPNYFVFILVFIAFWIVLNLWGDHRHWPHYDAPPFFWLQGFVSANALLLTVAVLIRQNRMAELAEHRAHLDLQINLLTEKKVSRAIALLVSMVPDHSPEAEQVKTEEHDDFTTPANPKALLAAIQKKDQESPTDGDRR